MSTTGFPSPAADYIEVSLLLNQLLIKKPAATFIVRAKGDSMRGAGIDAGDLLIIDRSLNATPQSIVVAMLNGAFTVQRLREIKVESSHDFEIWGVVAHVIKSFRAG